MRVTNLLINGYQGISFLDLDFDRPIVLIAGKNATGKTTIRDAIQFAITGSSSRVKLKKDYDQLVRLGSSPKDSEVSVTAGGFRFQRKVATGKAKENLDYPAILPILLGNQTFVDLSDAEKTATIGTVTGYKASKEKVIQLLKARHIADRCIELAVPTLRNGYPAAEKLCAGKKSECRGAWEALTKERFGTAKAAEWEAPVLTLDTPVQLAESKKNLELQIPDMKKAVEELEQQQQEINRHSFSTGVKYQCPQCEANLLVRDRKLVLDDIEDEPEPDVQHQQQVMTNLGAAKRELQEVQQQIAVCASQIEQAENAERIREETTMRAKDYLAQYDEWDEAAKAFAPSGIQMTIRTEAVKPVNEYLKQTAAAAGWRDIVIHPDLGITYGSIPYSLCSESEQWRINAAITEYLSAASGSKFFILDRMDVLHPDDRGQAINWLLNVAPSHDSIFVMATLKGKPTGLPPEIQTVWLNEGGDLEKAA